MCLKYLPNIIMYISCYLIQRLYEGNNYLFDFYHIGFNCYITISN